MAPSNCEFPRAVKTANNSASAAAACPRENPASAAISTRPSPSACRTASTTSNARCGKNSAPLRNRAKTMTPDPPLYEPDERATYTLEIVAKLTGISSQTILTYQEQGLIDRAQLDD